MARAALNKRGIPFNEIQVYNTETLDELKKAAGSDTVPTLVVGRSSQAGFEQVRYDALLDSAGYPAAGAFPPRAQAAPATPEGYEPPPSAEPATPAQQTSKPGPYDPSGLKGPEPKPGIYDPSVQDEKISVPTEAAYELAHDLARSEGLLVGNSSGAALYAAREVARRTSEGVFVMIFPDGGDRYLSSGLYRRKF